ncbi:MAG: deoxyhypusine synthase [Nanoarchaeota archaeon]|nr:deoxyhypusine synthase [Nanoarchaeota archaeon]MBU1632581.1 deoxyhypusine synthase [Nanoarchaeota archaeon]MBU1875791.1 deoxyhypusine synthase [Nanoarchaeota archaeon]
MQLNQEKVQKLKHIQYGSVKQCMTLEGHPQIKGYDFENGLDFKEFLKAYSLTGFQGTHLAQGIEIVKAMQREKAKIFLSFTSNQVSSGNREIIKFLVKNKKVDVLVTSAGGVEEDIIKCLKPFVIGNFESPGAMLFENGVNRTGNIFVPNDRFSLFDDFMKTFFERIYKIQKEKNKIFCPKNLIKELGIEINDEDSILYWAAKNDIPLFCPGIIDGSLGDLVYFFKQSHPDFMIDVSKEMKDMVDLVLNSEKTGGILLGGGISKHFTLNANIFKEGLDYVVYINTAQEYDGSDSGARVEEAITWGKVKTNAPNVKIHCDATIAFPLLVAGSFMD